MTEFRVRFEQEDGKGEIVNEKGVELTAREVVDCLNEQQVTIKQLKSELNDCTAILYSVFGEMNYLNYKSDPAILKKYGELFDDE